MNTNLLVLIIVLGAVILIGAAAYLGKYITEHKIKASDSVKKAIQGLSVAEAFALAMAPFLPVKSAAIIAKLFQMTVNAVNTAEALYKAATLPAEQRKATATSLITSELIQAGITPDQEIDKLISVSIDLMCRFLPKTNVTTPAPAKAVTAAVPPQE